MKTLNEGGQLAEIDWLHRATFGEKKSANIRIYFKKPHKVEITDKKSDKMKISAKTLNNNSSDPELAGGWGGQTEKSKMRLSRMIFPLYLLPRVGRPLLVAGGEEPLHVLGGAGRVGLHQALLHLE